jgi:hypothetical protein
MHCPQLAASTAEEQWADTQAQLLACRESLAAEVAKSGCLADDKSALVMSFTAAQQELQAEKVRWPTAVCLWHRHKDTT